MAPGAVLALPKCKGSPASGFYSYSKTKNWNSCVGDYEWKGYYINGKVMSERIVGVYKNGKANGRCYKTSWNYSVDSGWTWEGMCRNNSIVGTRKTYSGKKVTDIKINYSQFSNSTKLTKKITALKSAFILLPPEKRKNIQIILKKLDLYKSSIDGLYGKGTAAALTAYNKQNNNDSDLTKRDNASKLMTALLAVTASPTPKPKVQQTIETTETLPACPSSGNRHNCFGTETFASGAKYVGGYKDGKEDGQGTYTDADANGYKYVGEYKDGKRNGQGTATFPDGTKFIGEYKDDKRNGHFEVTFASGETYIGQYKDGKKSGQGTSTFADGTVQEGIWKDGEFQYANKPSTPAPVVKTPTQSDEIISASSGSGFAVSADGYVITNNHVIEGCQEVMVHTKNKDVTMRVITYDPQNDLALLKGDFRPSQVFALSSNYPELLQDVYVAGYPFGKAISASVKVTKGIISSLTGIGNNSSNIQIDAALQSGNSGGPIIDELGNVVGVAVSKLDAKYMFDNFGSIPENTNFGIKSSTVRNILASNDVDNPSPNQNTISKSLLGKMISNGTYYISFWMTMAQVEKLRTKKVLFESFE